MANPQRNENDAEGIGRANRDDNQHVHYPGWDVFHGGKSRDGREPEVGADYTREPFDEMLARDADGNLLERRGDTVTGFGEPLPERNYPRAYDRDELINTDLNPAMEYPRKTTATFRILAIVLGLALFALLLVAMWWNWPNSVKRAPSNSSLQQPSSSRVALRQFASMVVRAQERH